MRSAPRGGYDFSRKRDYRRKVWATGRDTLKRYGLSVADSHALLMPSLEGDEIDVALNAGFRESHLHVVDHEPAIVATLKRRYPRINTYGVTVSRAFERLAERGIKIRCANLDFCKQLSMPFASELSQVALLGSQPCRLKPTEGGFRSDVDSERYGSGVFADDYAVVAISQLRGRESRDTTALWTSDWSGLSQASLAEFEAETRHRIEGLLPAATVQRLLYAYRRLLELSENDRHRVWTNWMILGFETKALDKLIPESWKPHVQLLRTESYLSSSGQTMLWSVWEIESAKHRMEIYNAANTKRVAIGIAPTQWIPRRQVHGAG